MYSTLGDYFTITYMCYKVQEVLTISKHIRCYTFSFFFFFNLILRISYISAILILFPYPVTSMFWVPNTASQILNLIRVRRSGCLLLDSVLHM